MNDSEKVQQTAEVQPPAKKVSRARFLVLIPVFPLLVALAALAAMPLQQISTDPEASANAVIRPTAPVDPNAPEGPQGPSASIPQPEVTAASDTEDGGKTGEGDAKVLNNLFQTPTVDIKPEPKPVYYYGGGSSGSYSGGSSGGGGSSNPCSYSNIAAVSVSSAPYSSAEQQNFSLLNQARVDNGLAPLSWSGSHANRARAWAVHLATYNCPLAHSPSSHWDNGENAYWISGGSLGGLATRAHNGFMGSSGHRANILRDWFTVVGIGVAKSSTGAWYLIQNFGG